MHERDIPSIAAKATATKAEECFTDLSFAIGTSLAAAKRLTWEQTPWQHHKLSADQAHQIADSLSLSTKQEITPSAIQHALLLGETFRHDHLTEPTSTNPQLVVVFPHATHDVSRDEKFLRIWHDDVVRPAFDTAWKDSGLVRVFGAERDFAARHLRPHGTFHAKQGLPAEGFLAMLKRGTERVVRDVWPAWRDEWGCGFEGKHSDVRARVLDEAWRSITGMVKGHSDLGEFQNPVLLVVNRCRVDVGGHVPGCDVYRAVGEEWDRTVDARFVVQDSFRVVLQTVLSTSTEVERIVDGEEKAMAGQVVGVEVKRMAEDELEAGGYRSKRSRVG